MNSEIPQFSVPRARIIEAFQCYYGSEERGLSNALDYFDEVDTLYAKGGQLWRVIFVPSADDIDVNDLGLHWTNQWNIDRVSQLMWDYHGGVNNEFIIKIQVAPHSISVSGVDILGNVEEEEVNVSNSGILSFEIYGRNGCLVRSGKYIEQFAAA